MLISGGGEEQLLPFSVCAHILCMFINDAAMPTPATPHGRACHVANVVAARA